MVFIGICAFGNTYFIILGGSLVAGCLIGYIAAEYTLYKSHKEYEREMREEEERKASTKAR